MSLLENAADHLHEVYTLHRHHPGCESGFVTQSLCCRLMAVVDQEKLSLRGAEVYQELSEVQAAWGRTVDALGQRGWPPERIVLVFKTNRSPRAYRSSVQGNVVLLARERLKRHLGPTLWLALEVSAALSGIDE